MGEALESALDDLDGFFTFVVGTKDGFGVVRDPIACKPAVMAETDQYVAFGSEYRALVNLPGIEDAKRLGTRTRNRLLLEPLRCRHIILKPDGLRGLNSTLHAQANDTVTEDPLGHHQPQGQPRDCRRA